MGPSDWLELTEHWCARSNSHLAAAERIMRGIFAEGDSGDTISSIIKATRKGGIIALIGDFFFRTNQFPIGALMEKAITLRGGQLYAQKVRNLPLFA